MAYIEGFVLAVPTANKETYRAYAQKAFAVFKKHGATRLVECWGDDVPEGKLTDFRGAVKAEANETVVFSWIEYPDKQTRDVVNRAMSEDPAMQEFGEMPFDGKRMIFGGFEPIVDER
jgi:uncharacterized protein YbaA (DUF1428 family)